LRKPVSFALFGQILVDSFFNVAEVASGYSGDQAGTG
jgi:hypothetical protein